MKLLLLNEDEVMLRVGRLTAAMRLQKIDMALIQDNAMKYYLTGRVFAGWIMVRCDGEMRWFVRRPNHVVGDKLFHVRKPEEITSQLNDGFLAGVETIGFEFRTLSVADYNRLSAIFENLVVVDLSPVIMAARAVKTAHEINMMTRSGQLQTEVYESIPSLYHPGMTDIELQIDIERELRRHGCLGQFRIAGDSMELFMANILAGDNADNPTPYDFAMGGEGINPSLPVGANGDVIVEGTTVMVDANGNFTGYMTDMTRTFAVGDIPAEARVAHELSIEICNALSAAACPGIKASQLYEMAVDMVDEAGLRDFFMGHRQQAGFIGHGLGIEINEAPVIAPRSRDVIQPGNVFALEPKFVIPGVGAVGIENTYVVLPECSDQATRKLTNAPEQLINLV